MEKMNDLNDLLKHEIMDLSSAEDQIIAAIPAMIERANDPQLKKSLKEHLKITREQRNRLDQVQQLMGIENNKENSGLLGRLFKSSQTCLGMKGIIEEGNKIMSENMDQEVMDAAILAASQKVEHYEICGYGTARSYALQLGLLEVADLLSQTLDEEYEADRLLTKMAESRINAEAEANDYRYEESSRSENRSGARSQVEKPEMELASTGRKTAASSTGRSSAAVGSAPKGAHSRTGDSHGRSSTSTKKTSAKSSASRTSANGRSSGPGRGSSRGK